MDLNRSLSLNLKFFFWIVSFDYSPLLKVLLLKVSIFFCLHFYEPIRTGTLLSLVTVGQSDHMKNRCIHLCYLGSINN